MAEKIIRVVIADDHEVTRVGIRSILEAAKDIQVVGEAKNGVEAKKLVAELHPNILLLDLVMPGIRPFQIDRWVRENCLGTIVLILTGHDRDSYLSKAIDGGAVGFIAKTEPVDRLLQSIYRAVKGETVFSTFQFNRANNWRLNEGTKINKLSKRELQVLKCLARGLDNRTIAEELEISIKTVETHVTSILATLTLSSRKEVIVWARTSLFDS